METLAILFMVTLTLFFALAIGKTTISNHQIKIERPITATIYLVVVAMFLIYNHIMYI